MSIKFCKTCRKDVEIEDGFATCQPCRDRGAANREKYRQKKIFCKAIKPDKKRCDFEVHEKCGGLYCMKHESFWINYQAEEKLGKKIVRCNSRTQCDPDKPGIKAILPAGHTKKKCENCLVKERQKEKELREKKKSIGKKLTVKNLYTCIKCAIGVTHTIDNMGVRGIGEISNLCKVHFEKQQKIEEKRPDRERKEEFKLYDSTPKRKFRTYQKNARERDVDFNIDYDTFADLINSDCYYCGADKGKYTNGVDRVDNNIGYEYDNIVTACSMCNKMKNTLSESKFILLCAHIAHHNKLFDTKLYPEIFSDHYSETECTYESYKTGAKKRKYKFKLTSEEFDEIRTDPCYICGKESTDSHKNGIDRVDNNIGYIISNCKSCCGDCNFFKRALDYEAFLDKCACIAIYSLDRLEELKKNIIKSHFKSARIKPIVKSAGKTIKKSQSKNNRKKQPKGPAKKKSKANK